MNDFQVAFLVGLFGSIHCIGMCGPLAFGIPFTGHSKLELVGDKLIYNAGRVISYTLLGLLIGIVGRQLWLAGIQQGVSVLSGLLILTAAGSRLLKISIGANKYTARIMNMYNKLFVLVLKKQSGHFILGILNGLLPCGFVYLALIGAVNTPSVSSSALYMLCFGLGTIPLMVTAAVGTGLIKGQLRRSLNHVVPYFMLCLGVWFILRGMELNLPYLSPAPFTQTGICK